MIFDTMARKRTSGSGQTRRSAHTPVVGSLDWLVREVNRRRVELGYSLYRISHDTGIALNTVRRFFGGYGDSEPRVTGDVGDASRGRCRFGSAVAIAAAVGLRFDVSEAS